MTASLVQHPDLNTPPSPIIHIPVFRVLLIGQIIQLLHRFLLLQFRFEIGSNDWDCHIQW